MKRSSFVVAVVLGALALMAPARAEASRECVEVSDVVGDQVCTRYGAGWSVERKPPVTFRFGLRYAQFSTDGMTFSESYKKRARPDGYKGYSFGGEQLGQPTLSGLGGDGGVTVYLVDQLYLGIEGGLLLGSASTATFRSGNHTLSDAGGIDVVTFHAGAPIGYRIPLGRASIRGEVLFGGMLASLAQRGELDGKSERHSATSGRWMIEPRIAADIWFTQHLSFGAYAGVNLLDTRGTAMGLSMTWHVRAFDGDMSLW